MKKKIDISIKPKFKTKEEANTGRIKYLIIRNGFKVEMKVRLNSDQTIIF